METLAALIAPPVVTEGDDAAAKTAEGNEDENDDEGKDEGNDDDDDEERRSRTKKISIPTPRTTRTTRRRGMEILRSARLVTQGVRTASTVRIARD